MVKIAIIGAGISGLSFYLFLDKLGLTKHHGVTIYEAREAQDRTVTGEEHVETYNASVIGASIGLSTNGLRVLQCLDQGLYDELIKTGHVLKTCKLTSKFC